MDAFFDVIRLAITKPLTASFPARLTRAGFCFDSMMLKGIMPGCTMPSLFDDFFLLNSIRQINPAMTRLRRAEPRLLQWVGWLRFR